MDELMCYMLDCCAACGDLMSFNPDKVPSIRINDEGPRVPICRDCADKLNDIIEARGDERIPIQEGAYDAVPLNEVRFD